MGPAEIVASLKELCAEEGPRLSTERIVAWIEQIGGFESQDELIQFAKKIDLWMRNGGREQIAKRLGLGLGIESPAIANA